MTKKDNNSKQAPCEKEDKLAQKSIERLLLVGNSPNLAERQNGRVAWDRLMHTLEKGCPDYVPMDNVAKSFLLNLYL